jgi:hypothetical protein
MVRLLALKKELLFLALVLTYKTGIVGGAHGDEEGGEKQQQAVKINPRDKPELIKNTQSILPLPSKAKMLVWERKDHEANTDQIIKAYTKTFLTTKPLDQFEASYVGPPNGSVRHLVPVPLWPGMCQIYCIEINKINLTYWLTFK